MAELTKDAVEGKEGKREKKVRKRRKGAYRRLVAQMEFYFSDANLRLSKFLAKIYAADPWVPIQTFLSFNKVGALLTELEVGEEEESSQVAEVEKALRVIASPVLQLSEDGKKVTRVNPFKPADKEQVEARTIYVENLPSDADHESLKKLFSDFGEVVYVSIPRFPSSRRSKGFAFVEFSADSAVVAVLAAMEGVQGELASIKAFQEAETEVGLSSKRKLDEGEGEEASSRVKRLRVEEAGGLHGNEVHPQESQMDGGQGERLGGDLRVLSKEQWRRLRNKYLNDQRKNFSSAKQNMKKQWAPYRESAEANEKLKVLPLKKTEKSEDKGKPEKKEIKKEEEELDLARGLIVKVTVEGGVESVQGMKKKVREALGGEGVAYVDTRVGAPEAWIRCMDTEQARRLVRAGEGELVEGVEEEQYWAKIKKDREEKRSGKVVVPKVKNKKKLMQRIETMKSAHVYFD